MPRENKNAGCHLPQPLQSLHLRVLHPKPWKCLLPGPGLSKHCFPSRSNTKAKKTGSVLRIWVHPSRCTLSPSPCCCGQRPDPHGHTSRCCPLASGWVWSIGGASRRSEVEGGKSQVPTWTVPGSPASLPRPQLLSGGCLHTTLFPPAPFLKGNDSF